MDQTHQKSSMVIIIEGSHAWCVLASLHILYSSSPLAVMWTTSSSSQTPMQRQNRQDMWPSYRLLDRTNQKSKTSSKLCLLVYMQGCSELLAGWWWPSLHSLHTSTEGGRCLSACMSERIWLERSLHPCSSSCHVQTIGMSINDGIIIHNYGVHSITNSSSSITLICLQYTVTIHAGRIVALHYTCCMYRTVKCCNYW